MQAAQSAKSVLIAGMKARDRGDLAGAEALFRRALAADPDYARAHANLGELLSNQGRNEDAEQHLRRAIDLDADHVRAWNNLGNLLARFPARKADAEAAFQNALRIEPDNVAALHNHATLLKSGGDAAGAKALWQRAVAANPGHLNLPDSDYDYWLREGIHVIAPATAFAPAVAEAALAMAIGSSSRR